MSRRGKLVERIIETLGELGSGFSFVGRQVPFDVDGDEFFVDLLFLHIEQLRYVVVELKVGKFKPEYAGQLGFYVELVEDLLRRPAHGATVGLLLCTDKNDRVVRYALASSNQPIAIASYDPSPQLNGQCFPQRPSFHGRSRTLNQSRNYGSRSWRMEVLTLVASLATRTGRRPPRTRRR